MSSTQPVAPPAPKLSLEDFRLLVAASGLAPSDAQLAAMYEGHEHLATLLQRLRAPWQPPARRDTAAR